MGRRKKAPTQPKSHILVVQDKSGSMSGRAAETISGYNQFITKLREDAEGEVFVTLVQFDTYKDTVYSEMPLKDVPELTTETYRIGGMTALNDGVGEAIKRAEQFVKKGDNVGVTIMTDGGENSSQEFSKDAIAALIKQKESEGWQFDYLGAGQASWSGATMLGIADANVINYSGAAGQTAQVFAAAASVNTERTRGIKSSYFLATPEVKSRLETEAGSKVDLSKFGIVDESIPKRRTRRSVSQ